MSSTIFQSFQSKEALPVSQKEEEMVGGIRRRLSSLSLKNSENGSSGSWESFCRSKSYAGSSIKKWWDWSWAWILSRKPSFAQDLEMNEQETAILGCHNKGSWRHVFYKLKSELTTLLLPSDHKLTLPQTTTTTNNNNHRYSTRYYY